VDCQIGDWGAWGACSEACGAGTQERSREKTVVEANGGSCDYDLTATQACNDGPCAVDCEVGDWGAWGACSETCGAGSQERSREKTVVEADGGTCNLELTQTQACDDGPCAVDCEVGDWGAWGTCSVTCGEGSQERSREKTVVEAHGGTCDLELTATQDCSEEACRTGCAQFDEKNTCKSFPLCKYKKGVCSGTLVHACADATSKKDCGKASKTDALDCAFVKGNGGGCVDKWKTMKCKAVTPKEKAVCNSFVGCKWKTNKCKGKFTLKPVE